MTEKRLKDLIILIKGGGEMASGVAQRLVRSGFRVCITEIPEPLAVRRGVSFCEAVFAGQNAVEGLVGGGSQAWKRSGAAGKQGEVPVVIDPECAIRKILSPDVLVDAILARGIPGRPSTDAPLVIGLGPGFRAGRDVHFVIETNRGHRLGRVIEEGEAEPDTGIPGDIGGYTWERVLRAPAAGRFRGKRRSETASRRGRSWPRWKAFPLRRRSPAFCGGSCTTALRQSRT